MKDSYSVTTYSVQNILGLIDSGDIAIPEIQRPFVWDSTKVRDLIDSFYHGYPTGYLITWKNPDVKIKGGGTAEGKTVLIDGQQRITALMASLAGLPVLNDDYESKRVKIAFNPQYDGEDTPFAVLTPVIDKNVRWISDIAELFKPGFNSWTFVNDYMAANPDCDPGAVNASITDLLAIATRQLGCIVINADCTIDEVTDIFIRINSKGAVLSQADFAMSKIAADEAHGGSMLRKAIDYYCHLAVKPEFWPTVSQNDPEFMASEYAKKAEWLKDDRDDIYDPDYNDVLRVAFNVLGSWSYTRRVVEQTTDKFNATFPVGFRCISPQWMSRAEEQTQYRKNCQWPHHSQEVECPSCGQLNSQADNVKHHNAHKVHQYARKP